jgi:cyclase
VKRPNQVRLAAGAVLAAAVFASLILPPRSTAVAFEEPDWKKISFKVTKLGGNVYMLEGVGGFSGGNLAVAVGDDGVLLVDSSFPPLAPKLEAELKKLSKKPLRYVVNTHFHGDHTAGNTILGRKSTIIAHENVRRRLEKEGFLPEMPAPPQALPIITVDRGFAMYLNGDEVRATHPGPAHTDSDLVVVFKKANVVHLGDLFFNGMYPFIDLDHGGSVKGYVAAVEKALAELPPDAKVIPGHGPIAGRKELETFLAMLKDTVSLVEAGIAQNRSVANLRTSKIFAKYDDTWGKAFIPSDEYLDHLYRGLSPAKK